MAFTDLEAPVILLRSGNDDILTVAKYNDAALVLLEKTAALFDLKLDLCTNQQIALSNTTVLDEIYDTYKEQLEKALAYRQLWYFYFKNNDGDGTLTHTRMSYYLKKYDEMVREFSRWRVSNNVFTKLVNIMRG